VAYAGTVILFVTATRLTTAANAILLQYSAPIYVASLGAWFLGERTRGFEWAGLGVVLGGIVLFFFDRLSAGNLWGNGCAILSGVCFAGLILFMRKQKDESPVESVILGNLLTGLAGLPFMFGSVPDAATCLGILLMGVFQLGLSYILYSEAVKHVTALEAILITAIEAVLNPVWVFLVLGERPGPWALLGGGVVLASVTGCCVMAARKRSLPS
jgi:drug/metabolite transporter (DMT)-like permease